MGQGTFKKLKFYKDGQGRIYIKKFFNLLIIQAILLKHQRIFRS